MEILWDIPGNLKRRSIVELVQCNDLSCCECTNVVRRCEYNLLISWHWDGCVELVERGNPTDSVDYVHVYVLTAARDDEILFVFFNYIVRWHKIAEIIIDCPSKGLLS